MGLSCLLSNASFARSPARWRGFAKNARNDSVELNVKVLLSLWFHTHTMLFGTRPRNYGIMDNKKPRKRCGAFCL